MKKQVKHYYQDKNKFRPYYRENGKTKYLGRFDTKEEAIAAYKKWEQQDKEVEQLQQYHEVLKSAKTIELSIMIFIIIAALAIAIYFLKGSVV